MEAASCHFLAPNCSLTLALFSSPPSFFFTQEAAVMKTGVAGRINEWLNKIPESGKMPGGRPAVGRKANAVDAAQSSGDAAVFPP